MIFIFQVITAAIRQILQLEEPYWNRSISEPPRDVKGELTLLSIRGQLLNM